MGSRRLMAAAVGVGGWNIEAAAGMKHSYLYSSSSSSAYFPNPSNSNSNSNRTHVLVVAAAATGGGGGDEAKKKKKKKSDEKWVAKGVITESLPNGMFWVRLENGGDVVLGYVSGKIRRNSIRMLPGDYVNIELTRYDSTRGRIVYRLQPNNAAKHL